MVKTLPAMRETWVLSLGRENPLEKGMATHSSILAWRIPWTEEPGGLQSMGLQSQMTEWLILSLSHSQKCPKWSESCSVVSNFLWPHGLYSPWSYLGQNIEVGSLSLLQGIFPTQGSNPGLPHCRQILNQLSHNGSPRTPECVAYPFSSRSSWLRNRTRVSCIAGRLKCPKALCKYYTKVTRYFSEIKI